MPEFHEKECKRCSLWLAPEFYNKCSETKDGLNRWCKYCLAAYRATYRDRNIAYQKEYRKRNKDTLKQKQAQSYQKNRDERLAKQKEYHEARRDARAVYQKNWWRRRGWWQHLEKTYGVSKDDYLSMMDRQNGVCAICRKECLHYNKLSVDHDHKTGQVRGLLCHRCNTLLGKVHDNPIILREAVLYLERGGFR